ncbi:hypothetical protein DIPPA_20412 [Diplonema papillatum]|nr:hypothetical protein DIPPA_20412 [Diplonema papillatum]
MIWSALLAGVLLAARLASGVCFAEVAEGACDENDRIADVDACEEAAAFVIVETPQSVTNVSAADEPEGCFRAGEDAYFNEYPSPVLCTRATPCLCVAACEPTPSNASMPGAVATPVPTSAPALTASLQPTDDADDPLLMALALASAAVLVCLTAALFLCWKRRGGTDPAAQSASTRTFNKLATPLALSDDEEDEDEDEVNLRRERSAENLPILAMGGSRKYSLRPLDLHTEKGFIGFDGPLDSSRSFSRESSVVNNPIEPRYDLPLRGRET